MLLARRRRPALPCFRPALTEPRRWGRPVVSGLSRLPWLPAGWVARRSTVSGVCAGLVRLQWGVPAPAYAFYFFLSTRLAGLKPPRHDAGEARHEGARAHRTQKGRRKRSRGCFPRECVLGGGSERRGPRPPGPRPPWVARGHVTRCRRAFFFFFFPVCRSRPAFPEGSRSPRGGRKPVARGHGRWHFLARSERFPGAAGARPGRGFPPPVGPVPMLSRWLKGVVVRSRGRVAAPSPRFSAADRCESRCEVGPPASAASGASGRLGGAKPRGQGPLGDVSRPWKKAAPRPSARCPPGTVAELGRWVRASGCRCPRTEAAGPSFAPLLSTDR